MGKYVNAPIEEKGMRLRDYPAMMEITGFRAIEAKQGLVITEETIREWINSPDSSDYDGKVRCALFYFAKKSPETACRLARAVIASAPETPAYGNVIEAASRVIAKHRGEEPAGIVPDGMDPHGRGSPSRDARSACLEEEDGTDGA